MISRRRDFFVFMRALVQKSPQLFGFHRRVRAEGPR